VEVKKGNFTWSRDLTAYTVLVLSHLLSLCSYLSLSLSRIWFQCLPLKNANSFNLLPSILAIYWSYIFGINK
jgi:hypothetical protein